MISQLVRRVDELRDIVPAWDALTRNALESNAFYESWALLPALEQLAAPRVAILLIWLDNSHTCLTGLFPLVHETTYYRCPASHWHNWQHPHCPVGTPLVHRNHARKTLKCLFDWLHHQVHATVFSLHHIPVDGLLFQHLQALAQDQGHLLDTSDQWERAMLHTDMEAEHYLQSHQRRKRLKQFSRLRRRLEERGELEFHTLLPGESADLNTWIHDFLHLEHAGWKGQQKTALQSSPGGRVFAETLMRNAATQGQLMMLKMTLNGEPLAMKLNLTNATQGAFALKIAYDERYAAYSPGVLLELENICVVLGETRVGWMDSCAIPHHPMINRLWAERRRMANLRISTPHLLSKPLLHTLRMVKSVYLHYK